MKRGNKSIFGVLFLIVILASCNSDLEKRVSNLERRVVEIENKSQAQRTGGQELISATSQPAAEPKEKPEGPLPEFSFEKTLHDFGQINEGDVVTHTFKFTNTGDAPLVIQNATASCGCTVPSYPKEPIAKGETGEIVVKFDSSNKPGVQNKTVTLTANTFPATSKLNIKSVVIAKNGGAGASAK